MDSYRYWIGSRGTLESKDNEDLVDISLTINSTISVDPIYLKLGSSKLSD